MKPITISHGLPSSSVSSKTIEVKTKQLLKTVPESVLNTILKTRFYIENKGTFFQYPEERMDSPVTDVIMENFFQIQNFPQIAEQTIKQNLIDWIENMFEKKLYEMDPKELNFFQHFEKLFLSIQHVCDIQLFFQNCVRNAMEDKSIIGNALVKIHKLASNAQVKKLTNHEIRLLKILNALKMQLVQHQVLRKAIIMHPDLTISGQGDFSFLEKERANPRMLKKQHAVVQDVVCEIERTVEKIVGFPPKQAFEFSCTETTTDIFLRENYPDLPIIEKTFKDKEVLEMELGKFLQKHANTCFLVITHNFVNYSLSILNLDQHKILWGDQLTVQYDDFFACKEAFVDYVVNMSMIKKVALIEYFDIKTSSKL